MRTRVKDFGKIQTSHPELQSTLSELDQVSSTDKVLVLGEAGTGRRLVAQMIHEDSAYSENEIVRYVPGKKIDIAAHRVVLVMDIQYFNSVEQEAMVTQMLSTQNQCLWIATAQPDFFELAARGLVRKDLVQLFTRKIKMPNLKERSADLPFLIEQILLTLSWVTGRVLRVSPSAVAALENYFWSENIRELEQILEAAALSITGSVLEAQDLNLVQNVSTQQIITLAEMERKLIMQTLQITQNNKSHAARLLGISIRTLRNKLSQYKSESSTTLEGFHESNI
jgi:two-component system response regulator AtoC